MVTLAFAQMIYFVANQWRGLTGGENGLQGIPRELFGVDLSRPVRLLLRRPADRPVRTVLACGGSCTRRSGTCWWRSGTTRPAPGRIGYPVDRYKLLAFVLSAALSGLAGGLFAISHGFASLQEVYWTTSGKAVMMVVLGGIGTLWGSTLGAALVVQLEDYLSTSGFDGIGIVTGTVFVLVVLLFRHGLWGAARQLARCRRPGAARPQAVPTSRRRPSRLNRAHPVDDCALRGIMDTICR